MRTTPLVLPPSSPRGRKSTLTPLNAQNVGRRSFGSAGLFDFISICLPVPLRISMKKMSSFEMLTEHRTYIFQD